MDSLDPDKGSAVYAHRAVRIVMRQVATLEQQWNEIRMSREKKVDPVSKTNVVHPFEHILRLINSIGKSGLGIDEDKEKEIFRYFATAALYAQVISYSCYENLRSLRADEVAGLVTLSYLNDLASKALSYLDEHIAHGRDGRKKIEGNFGILQSSGSVPYQQVIATDDRVVAFRRGFELAHADNPATKRIHNGEEKFGDLPYRCYRNSVLQTENFDERTIAEVLIVNKPGIPDGLNKILVPREDRVLKMILGKYISWVNVHLPGVSNDKTVYEIDIMDNYIQSNPGKAYIKDGKLQELSGRDKTRRDAKKHDLNFDQEDVLVSFLSPILYEQCQENPLASEDSNAKLEDWATRLIRIIASNSCDVKRRSQKGKDVFYVGFSFETLIDGGYADKSIVNGSANLLLLALTRGLLQLGKNHGKLQNVLGCFYRKIKPSTESEERSAKNSPKNSNAQEYECPVHSSKEMRKREGIRRVQSVTRKHPFFLGATSDGVTVRTRVPKFLYLAIGTTFTLILGYGIPGSMFTKNYEEFIPSLITTTSILTGACLMVTKLYYRKWHLIDMIHRIRRARRMTELGVVLPQGKKDAIKVLSQIENPEGVFSRWRSCAFANNGQGQFEVDEDIRVHDLIEAGFLFGVDYYGTPVVSNRQGTIRTFFIQLVVDTADEDNEDHGDKVARKAEKGKQQRERRALRTKCGKSPHDGYLHIEGKHDRQPKYVYQVPIDDLIVGTDASVQDYPAVPCARRSSYDGSDLV